MPLIKEHKREVGVHFARPRCGRISTAVAYSGVSRSRLYELAAITPGLFKKNGTATIVDFDVLDRALDVMPTADIRVPKTRKSLDALKTAAD
jgi:hypothetical protein